MKLPRHTVRPARIEMLPLIDIVFLLLVVFIYAMLSISVHRGLPVTLPVSATADPAARAALTLTVTESGALLLEGMPVERLQLTERLRAKIADTPEKPLKLFADGRLAYQSLFDVMDRVRAAGVTDISLQAEVKQVP